MRSKLAHTIRKKVSAKVRSLDWLDVTYWFLFALTIVIACYVRFANYYPRMQWFDDTARDMMVAKKIAQSGKYQNVRPLAFASHGRLNNSSVYYNVLAVLWSFGNDRSSITYGATIFGILSLFAGWEIGRQIGGRWLGLACFFVLSINMTLAQSQISVYQRNFLPSFSLLIVMLAIWTWNCPSFRRFSALVAVFTFATLIHYSILTFAPGIVIVGMWVLFKNPLSLVKKIALFSLIGIACYCAWSFTTQSSAFALFSYAGFTRSVQPLSTGEAMETHLAFLYDFLIRAFWFSLSSWYMPLIWIVFLTIGAVLGLRKKEATPFYVYWFFLGTYLITHLIFWNSRLFTFGFEYMLHYQSLAVMLIPIVTYQVFGRWGSIARIFALEIVCVFLFIVECPVLYLIQKPSAFFAEAETTQAMTQQMTDDFAQLKASGEGHDYVITDYTSWANPGWFAPAFLTFIEEKDGVSVASLRQDGNNLEYNYPKHPDVLYLICAKWRYKGIWTVRADDQRAACLQPFLESYLNNYMDGDLSSLQTDLLIDSSQNKLQFNVFRIRQLSR